MMTSVPEWTSVPLFTGGYTDVRLDLVVHFCGTESTHLIGWTITDSRSDETIGMGVNRPVPERPNDRALTDEIRGLLQEVRRLLHPF